jgi:uncharacterized protein (TIGR02145 family)
MRSKAVLVYKKKYMKKLFTLVIVLSAFISNAQRTLFGSQNNYVAATAPAAPVPTVISGGGRIWMDRNLGASQVATGVTDVASYGDLYEWGRANDGHQLRTASITATQSLTDSPVNSLFIVGAGDWRNPSNNNLWQGVNGINNPCPSGFRIPTKAEWEIEIASWSTQNKEGAFASPLKLPTPGFRDNNGGGVMNGGLNGDYWASTIDGTNSFIMYIHVGAGTVSFPRTYGFACRCIKE